MIKYFDAHGDTLTEHCGKPLWDVNAHINLQKAQIFDFYAQFFAIFIDDLEFSEQEARREFLKVYDYALSQFSLYGDKISLCKNSGDILRAQDEKKIAALLSIEGANVLAGDIENVQKYYDMGFRMMTLTWNNQNSAASGVRCEEDGGLTPFGREVVSEMDRLKMMIDISHIGEKGFWQVMELSKRPIFASHSNLKSVCGHFRNLSDEQLNAIVQSGGGCGINLCRDFIADSGDCSVYHVLKHVEGFLNLGAKDALFVGADLDGVDSTPDNLDSVDKMPLFYEEIKKQFGQKTADDIFFDNLFRLVGNWI